VRLTTRAFTLIELLVVLAILVVLAGMLFPVFRGARDAANKTTCLMNMRQTQQAFSLYFTDYDDRFVPVNHQPAGEPNSRNDRTWVQLTLPYIRSFSVFKCPGDYSVRPSPETTFDQDLVPGDTYTQYYTASLHVDLGYNFLYLSPIVADQTGNHAETRMVTSVGDPTKTIMLVDSVWSRNSEGMPTGGGSWLVTPPCRYVLGSGGRRLDTFLPGDSNHSIVITGNIRGWDPNPKSPLLYGNAWPWHSGRMNVIRVDGSARSVAPGQLSSGCDLRSNWGGYIKDRDSYIWDSE
jgi:prepilin-type N-terminal cleavage/methylation domain-containing protein